MDPRVSPSRVYIMNKARQGAIPPAQSVLEPYLKTDDRWIKPILVSFDVRLLDEYLVAIEMFFQFHFP